VFLERLLCRASVTDNHYASSVEAVTSEQPGITEQDLL
jgi:hypothetical protein